MFSVTVHSTGEISIRVEKSGVRPHDVGVLLVRAANSVFSQPDSVLPTVAELREKQRYEEVLRNFPASWMYFRDSATVWLSDTAADEIGRTLEEAGWKRISAPAPMPCDYTLNPEAVTAALQPTP